MVFSFYAGWFVSRRCFFFFQAEDGIRDYKVTGVQTCALPICAGQRQGGGRFIDRRTGAAQPRDLLAVDSGEQTHAAVGLLLSLQGKVVLGNIDEEFTQQLSQRGKRHSATD